MTLPGAAKPCSGRTWWQMPELMSKKLGMPCSATNSRMDLWFWAYFSSEAGTMWSRTMTIFSGARTLLTPILRNSWMMAAELSWERT